ncbi:MAG: CHASE domain-containing protein [Planctomycetaceae bacterium]|nr:CHASE domain-containing protein [Planctomycetaceae bacterium]
MMSQYFVSVAILAMGAALSTCLYFIADELEHQRALLAFNQNANDRIRSIKASLEVNRLVLNSLKAFYAGTDNVTEQEFRQFMQPLLKSVPDLQAVGWAPRIARDQRPLFERTRRRTITEHAADAKLVSAAERPYYFPLEYIEPLAGRDTAMGFDAGSCPKRLAAMNEACDSGHPTITGQIRTVTDAGDEISLLVYVPIFRNATPTATVDQRREHLAGFVVRLVRIDRTVQSALTSLPPRNIDVHLFDLSDNRGPEWLYSQLSPASRYAGMGERLDVKDLTTQLCRTETLDVPGRRWQIVCTPASGQLEVAETSLPLMVLLGGLAATATLTAYLVATRRNAVRTAGMASLLSQANASLEQENHHRRQALHELQSSKDFLQKIIDALPDPLMVVGLDHRVAHANRAASKATGDNPSSQCMARCRAAETPDESRDSASNPCPVKAVVQTRRPVTVRHANPTLDGDRIVEICASPILDAQGRVVQIVESHRDITEMVRAHEEISRLARFPAENPNPVMRVSARGILLYANEAAADLLAGLNCRVGAPLLAPWKGALDESLKIQKAREIEFVCGERIYSLTFSPAPDGAYSNIYGMDITERRRAAAALLQSRQEAEAANSAKSQFLANMSHEIRTPMTAIMGFTELLADPNQSPAERANCLSIVRRNGEHLLEVINDILDLSKIEAGKMALEIKPCNLTAMLADIASVMRVRAGQHGVTVAIEYATAIPQIIQTDTVRLRQALVNLVGNAVKFTEKGSVRIVAALVGDAAADPSIRIEVIDSGIGISPDQMGRLFQSFQQADASTSRKYGGTGLGLAITRHIAQMLQGSLDVASELGKGSTFTLTIPTGNIAGSIMLSKPCEGLHTSTEPVSVSIDLTGLRVLLAEDGPDNQRLITTLLRKAGADVDVAENGRLAVEAAMNANYDVILMDMQMPEMDGYEATRALRRSGMTTPILALTAHAMTADRDKSIAAGCDEHLTKPVNRAALLTAVRTHATGTAPDRAARPAAAAPQPLASDYADDPDMCEIIGKFVEALSDKCALMTAALKNVQTADLTRLAHQLKGAAGGYGYPTLTDAARHLETAAKANDIEAATLAFKHVADLCRAIQIGWPTPGRVEP